MDITDLHWPDSIFEPSSESESGSRRAQTAAPSLPPKFLVTHPGRGHADDLLSTAILLALLGRLPVFRREPTGEDLSDPRVVVYDAGQKHDPQMLNFDHHQLPASNLKCSLTLILEHFKLHEAASKYWEWLESVEILDTQGLAGMRKFIESGGDGHTTPYISPVDHFLLRWWGNSDIVSPDSVLHALLYSVGLDMVRSLGEIEHRVSLLEESTEFLDVGEPWSVAWINIPKEDSPVLHLDYFWKTLNIFPVVHVSHHDRGKGFALHSNNPGIVNFRAVSAHPKIHFVTASGGFAATDDKYEKHEVLELVKMSKIGRCGQ